MLIQEVVEVGQKADLSLYTVGCLVQLRKRAIKQVAYKRYTENDFGIITKITVGMSWDYIDYVDYKVYWQILGKETTVKEIHIKKIG